MKKNDDKTQKKEKINQSENPSPFIDMGKQNESSRSSMTKNDKKMPTKKKKINDKD